MKRFRKDTTVGQIIQAIENERLVIKTARIVTSESDPVEYDFNTTIDSESDHLDFMMKLSAINLDSDKVIIDDEGMKEDNCTTIFGQVAEQVVAEIIIYFQE